MNVAVLLKEGAKFSLSHVPRVLPDSVAKLSSKRVALVKRERSLGKCLQVLERGLSQLESNRAQQSQYLANVRRLQKSGWRIFAVAHASKQTMPLRTEEPLSVDCSFSSAAQGFEGKLSFARVSTDGKEAVVVDEAVSLPSLLVTVYSGEEAIGMTSLSPESFAMNSSDLEAPLLRMLASEFLQRLFQQIVHEAFAFGEFNSGPPSAAANISILSSKRDFLTIGLSARYQATFRLANSHTVEEIKSSCKEENAAVTEALKCALLFAASKFREFGREQQQSKLLKPLVDRLRHFLACTWIR